MNENRELPWYCYVEALFITLTAFALLIGLWIGVTNLMRTIESALAAIQ